MANEEQLAILRQGVDVWNKWRKEDPIAKANLSEADLNRENLIEANLRDVNLNRANLSGANLSGAYLRGANLKGANLKFGDLRGAYLGDANLKGANLEAADLTETNLTRAYLSEANLHHAKLAGTNLSSTSVNGTIFISTRIDGSIFDDVDLREAIGLENTVFSGPSSIATNVFSRSKGNIPEFFLRGCGLSDWEIEETKLHNPDLSNEEINKILYRIYDLRATQALQISPLFISYGHGDSTFVDKLENQLNAKGIRFWRDIHDMKAGRMETQIDQAINQNRTVLLVLSENSIKSDWVEHEVRTARGLEKDMGLDVLCPVALDDGWKSSHWPKRVMEQIMEYNILDFSAWQDDVKFDGMFRKLIDGLELFYKDKSHGE